MPASTVMTAPTTAEARMSTATATWLMLQNRNETLTAVVFCTANNATSAANSSATIQVSCIERLHEPYRLFSWLYPFASPLESNCRAVTTEAVWRQLEWG